MAVKLTAAAYRDSGKFEKASKLLMKALQAAGERFGEDSILFSDVLHSFG